MRGRFRLVANAVDVVDLDEPLPNLPVARALWAPKPDFATSAAAWLTAGAAHHTVLSTAVGMDVFEDFAEIAQTELLTIDEGTTIRGFKKELAWNAAYYKLAGGL
jgi:L-arabinose isomerase